MRRFEVPRATTIDDKDGPQPVRTIDNEAIAAAGAVRRRSEYHYAVFEYLRSAKILETLEKTGVAVKGRILDAGCGAGGVTLSLAEESSFAVGLDLDARFRGTGTRLASEKGIGKAAFLQGDGSRLPFRDGSFDLVLSHSVIEHVAEAQAYLRECHRVLRPSGVLYLSTAPYLSLTGAHLPRLRVPVPLHLLLGRRRAFPVFRFLARRAPWTLTEGPDSSSFVRQAGEGRPVGDSLRQLVTVRLLGSWIDAVGFRRLREDRHLTGFFRKVVPTPLRRALEARHGTRDVMIGQIECVLVKP